MGFRFQVQEVERRVYRRDLIRTFRLYFVGSNGNKGYQTRIDANKSIEKHPDVKEFVLTVSTSNDFTNTTLSSGIPSVSSITLSLLTATTPTDVSIKYTSSVGYFLETQQLVDVPSKATNILDLELTCSLRDPDSITSSLLQNGSNLLPSWLTIDSSASTLTVSAPNLNETSAYTFDVKAAIGQDFYTKTVKLQVVVTCRVDNCKE